MLTQLSQLNSVADGRYATTQELQFLKDFVATSNQRIEAYKAIRDQEAMMLDTLQQTAKAKNPGSMYRGADDASQLFLRDQKHILRVSAAAMLFNDPDFLREGLLLWHRSIIKAFGVTLPSQVAFQVWPEVMANYLSEEASKLLSPLMGLGRAILG